MSSANTIKLRIRNFSCLSTADLQLSQITVLVGPQASGKSIISKLVFFFLDVLSRQFAAIEELKTFDEFRLDLADDFKTWFPPSAWGNKHFQINFEVGSYSVNLIRSRTRTKKAADKIVIKFSSFFERDYKNSLQAYSRGRKKTGSKELDPSREFDLIYRVRNAAERSLRKALGYNFPESQLFVPAGRSFFTSVGKAFAALERGLDPVTARFGRYFGTLRDRGLFRRYQDRLELHSHYRHKLSQEIFGGRIRISKGEEFVEADDGRRIPFGMLSSGQQELLPLLVALDNFRFRDRYRIYIEEPEAHLFPSAQSDLIDFLVHMGIGGHGRYIITTHSPYVLTRLNVLKKAALIAKKKPRSAEKIQKIIRGNTYVGMKGLAAYTIKNKQVISVIGKDGLIDGDYLDNISGQLSREFNELLEIEYSR